MFQTIMARRRFFVASVRNAQAELTGDDAHHLTKVLRVEPGQRYEISDNESAYLAEVTEARKARVAFRVLDRLGTNPPPVRLHLYVALIKFDRLEWIFEKGTELGVERFILVVSERSEKGLDKAAAKRWTRWERILLESSQQSRRDRLPELAMPLRFSEALAQPADWRGLLDESREAGPVLAALPASPQPTDVAALLLGPEGGWTDEERGQAVAAGWRGVSLGSNILRAETAAVAAAAVLSAGWSASCNSR